MMDRSVGEKGDVDRYILFVLVILIAIVLIIVLFYEGIRSVLEALFIKFLFK